MLYEPRVFDILAVLIEELDVAVVSGIRPIVLEQHHPYRRVVVPQGCAKDKYKARQLLGALEFKNAPANNQT
jgi:hypothetical protein